MTKLTTAILGASVALSLGAIEAQASTLGLPIPLETYSLWDTFSAVNFSDDAPDTAVTADFTATLSSAHQAGTGVVTGMGQRLYGGTFTGTPGAFGLTVEGVASDSVETLSLQLKFTSPGTGTAADFFTVLLDGVAGTKTFVSNSNEGGQLNFSIYDWTWTNLDIASAETFTITATSAADHVTLDAVQITNGVQIVPEPSVGLLLGAGMLMAAGRRRRQA